MRGAEAERGSEPKQWTPKRAVKIQNQTCPVMGNRMRVLENLLHVCGKVERFRKDDEIELAPKLQIFASHGMKFPVRQPRACRSNLLFRKIDADDIAIWEQFEQVSRAASDFQDTRPSRNQIPIIRGQEFAVEPPACRWFCWRCVIEGAEPVKVPFQQRWNVRHRQDAQ